MNIVSDYVSLCGDIIPKNTACISIEDRGMRFGDGVFETVLIAYGTAYCWDLHRTRLQQGCMALRIPYDTSKLQAQCIALIEKNHVHHGMLRIMVTRGAGSEGYLPTYANQPTVIIETISHDIDVLQTLREYTLYVSSYKRLHPHMLPTQAKLMQGVNATLARLEAQDEQCDDALMLDINNHISEAASGNILWQYRNQYYTPHLDSGCVAGTMLARLKTLLNQPVHHILCSIEMLENVEAIIMTNAIKGAVAISSISSKEHHYQFVNSTALAAHCHTLIQKDIAQECQAS